MQRTPDKVNIIEDKIVEQSRPCFVIPAKAGIQPWGHDAPAKNVETRASGATLPF